MSSLGHMSLMTVVVLTLVVAGTVHGDEGHSCDSAGHSECVENVMFLQQSVLLGAGEGTTHVAVVNCTFVNTDLRVLTSAASVPSVRSSSYFSIVMTNLVLVNTPIIVEFHGDTLNNVSVFNCAFTHDTEQVQQVLGDYISTRYAALLFAVEKLGLSVIHIFNNSFEMNVPVGDISGGLTAPTMVAFYQPFTYQPEVRIFCYDNTVLASVQSRSVKDVNFFGIVPYFSIPITLQGYSVVSVRRNQFQVDAQQGTLLALVGFYAAVNFNDNSVLQIRQNSVVTTSAGEALILALTKLNVTDGSWVDLRDNDFSNAAGGYAFGVASIFENPQLTLFQSRLTLSGNSLTGGLARRGRKPTYISPDSVFTAGRNGIGGTFDSQVTNKNLNSIDNFCFVQRTACYRSGVCGCTDAGFGDSCLPQHDPTSSTRDFTECPSESSSYDIISSSSSSSTATMPCYTSDMSVNMTLSYQCWTDTIITTDKVFDFSGVELQGMDIVFRNCIFSDCHIYFRALSPTLLVQAAVSVSLVNVTFVGSGIVQQ